MKVGYISIVTNSYNSAEFIDRLYHSLNCQTDKNFEWIIVDDGSNDNTIEIISSLKFDNIPAVKFYEMPFNSGGGLATSVAMLKAEGDIIVRIDHDDELEPNAINEIRNSFSYVQNDDKIAGVLYRSTDTFGKKIESLCHGQVFKFSEFINTEKKTTDGVLALKAKIAKQYYSLPERGKIGLSSTTLLDISRSYYFQFSGVGSILHYHRDNPNSVTLFPRISNKTVYSYARSLDFHDRYYYASPLKWLRHTLALKHYSLMVYKSILPVFQYCRRPSTRAWCLLIAPIGIIVSQIKSKPNIVFYPEEDPLTCLRLVKKIKIVHKKGKIINA